MKIRCIWEHNGDDSILYAENFIGAFARGASKDSAIQKMSSEIKSYLRWKGALTLDCFETEIVQEKCSKLTISDADTDVLFDEERKVLESQPDFLKNAAYLGSYDEEWSLRKVLRRFIWHDRIHAKAMYRMAVKTFGADIVPNIFQFDI